MTIWGKLKQVQPPCSLEKTSVSMLPVLYCLHVFAAVPLLLQGLPLVGSLLDVGQHVGHERLLQPLPNAVHQLLLFPADKRKRKSLGGGS